MVSTFSEQDQLKEVGMTTTEDLYGGPLPVVPALTLGGLLRETCSQHGASEALVFDDPLLGRTVRWSYEKLWQQSRAVAKGLLATGASPGARVGILLSNRPEAIATLFGAALAGLVAVPLSTFATASELALLVDRSELATLVTQTHLGRRALFHDVCDLTVPLVVAVHTPAWTALLTSGAKVTDAQLDAVIVTPSDEALVTWSSGTTAEPKGVVHRHLAPSLQLWQQAELFGRTPATRMWTALPLFWTAGLTTAVGATLAAGGCCVLQEGFDAGTALALMARERVTEPYTLPHQAKALEGHPEWLRTDLSAMSCVFGKSVFARHPTVAGDPNWVMPVGWGLTETCAFVVAHPSTATRAQVRGSLGRLLPGNVLRVVDPVTRQPVPRGTDGELLVKGPTLMDRYVGRQPEECVDGEGFFATGDVGCIDAEGLVHWIGRRTEMIKTGGANVSPAEVEVQLRACSPVRLARVLAIPDELLDQVAVLCVELTDGSTATPEELTAFLRLRLASYKVPKHVLIFGDGQIPLTAGGTKVRDELLLPLVLSRLTPTTSGAT
jgi:fatty-acyl-CoA synthase